MFPDILSRIAAQQFINSGSNPHFSTFSIFPIAKQVNMIMYLHMVYGLELFYFNAMGTIKYLHPLPDLELTEINALNAYASIPKYDMNF